MCPCVEETFLFVGGMFHFVTCLRFEGISTLFPNSHAMGSCKTNRRTGAVGSPSELVGGWCPGHVLMASGSCDAGVPVML